MTTALIRILTVGNGFRVRLGVGDQVIEPRTYATRDEAELAAVVIEIAMLRAGARVDRETPA